MSLDPIPEEKVRTLYDVLGLERGATQKEIVDRFRVLAKEHHPDKGGDIAVMRELQEAYDVLHDPLLRHDYDVTGALPGSVEAIASRQFRDLMKAVLDQFDPSRGSNLIDDARNILIANQQKYQGAILERRAHVKRLEAIRERLTVRGGLDIIGPLIEEKIEDHLRIMAEMTVGAEVASSILDLLPQYEYRVDEPPSCPSATRDT